MSFHGGLIGTMIAGAWFCRKHRLSTLEMTDITVVAVPLGLALGRIGNFINAELWGRPTSVPWAMVFPTDPLGIPRHPSQLYEAGLEGLFLFALLFALSKLQPPRGSLIGTFLLGYGLIRFALEFVRNPDAHLGTVLGPFSMGQILSAPMVLGGLALIVWSYARKTSAPGETTPAAIDLPASEQPSS
jgi:phosphatidylglycerol:prolipoprotein diacylglycerol transferase